MKVRTKVTTKVPEPEIRMKPAPACAMSSNESKIRTRIVGNPPREYYGADFNHIFATDPEGCSLKGFQVSEHVTTQRDDFRVGATDVALGQKIWTLTESNSLDRPDRIRTRAGANGIGANPLRRWPAVLDQNQLWYYRRQPSTVWQLGPGTMIKVTLSGNAERKGTLTVTTTDHGVSKTEPYRGPAVRLSSDE